MYRSTVLILVTLIFGAALAHEHATGVVAERMRAMKSMDREMKVIGDTLVGKTVFDVAALRHHVDVLHEKLPPGRTLISARQ